MPDETLVTITTTLSADNELPSSVTYYASAATLLEGYKPESKEDALYRYVDDIKKLDRAVAKEYLEELISIEREEESIAASEYYSRGGYNG